MPGLRREVRIVEQLNLNLVSSVGHLPVVRPKIDPAVGSLGQTESEAQLKVGAAFVRPQHTVLSGIRNENAVLDSPLSLTHDPPAGEVTSVEQRSLTA